MISFFKEWMYKYFSDIEALSLFFWLLAVFLILFFFGAALAPVLASIVIAYILQGEVNWLKRIGMSERWAVLIVFLLFMACFILILTFLIPLLWEQISVLITEIPYMVKAGQKLLHNFSTTGAIFATEKQIELILNAVNTRLAGIGQWALTFSLSKITSAITWMVYIVLVPLLVFFFLKDKTLILAWINKLLPKKRRLIDQVTTEMNAQIANYIRGKFIEVVVVTLVSLIAFLILDVNYATLLAISIGLSVIIPYIGAAVVTIPVLAIGFFQWGWSNDFFILSLVYFVIQALDGNLLVPLLFSEKVNLHPIAIITAVLIFGHLWGFWGIFFAIPLATLCKAVMSAWPSQTDHAVHKQS